MDNLIHLPFTVLCMLFIFACLWTIEFIPTLNFAKILPWNDFIVELNAYVAYSLLFQLKHKYGPIEDDLGLDAGNDYGEKYFY